MKLSRPITETGDPRHGSNRGLPRVRFAQPCLPRILLVEADHELRSLLRRALTRIGYEVTECSGACQLQALLTQESDRNVLSGFGVILCDVQVLDPRTRALVVAHQQSQDQPPLVLIKHQCSPEALQPCHELNPIAVFENPYEVSRHTRTIHTILNRYQSKSPRAKLFKE